VCSACEPDGLRGQRATDEAREIHDLAFFWVSEGWFEYDVEWDPQLGIHEITVQLPDDPNELLMTPCQFDTFIFGMKVALDKLRTDDGGASV
jgi:hypothetical protein